ncbi:proline-rich protein 36-like [Schistocerca cancellata]|uniref:proline-rich protein 36-like n=1 Tax=Schistocerca cancellata TaxID=274614 RepID=UPI0021173417|nr:proline-rich protein 36-like [Schistocerca cancellata]
MGSLPNLHAIGSERPAASRLQPWDDCMLELSGCPSPRACRLHRASLSSSGASSVRRLIASVRSAPPALGPGYPRRRLLRNHAALCLVPACTKREYPLDWCPATHPFVPFYLISTSPPSAVTYGLTALTPYPPVGNSHLVTHSLPTYLFLSIYHGSTLLICLPPPTIQLTIYRPPPIRVTSVRCPPTHSFPVPSAPTLRPAAPCPSAAGRALSAASAGQVSWSGGPAPLLALSAWWPGAAPGRAPLLAAALFAAAALSCVAAPPLVRRLGAARLLLAGHALAACFLAAHLLPVPAALVPAYLLQGAAAAVLLGLAVAGAALSAACLDRLPAPPPPPSRPRPPPAPAPAAPAADGRLPARVARAFAAPPLALFVGLGQAFMMADFSRWYVACVLSLPSVSLCFVALGALRCVASLTLNLVLPHICRLLAVGVGAAFHSCLLLVLVLWQPSSDDSALFFVIAAAWGVCDSIWETLALTSGLTSQGDAWPEWLARWDMFRCLGLALAFVLHPLLCVQVKLYILAATLVLGVPPYAWLEMQHDAKTTGL